MIASLPGRSLWAQAAASAADPVPAVVQQARAAAALGKITTVPVHGPVSVLMGSGGNIAVLPGKDGKVLVDAGFSTSKPQITDALSALGPAPLRTLINTHWHFDHTDGNEWMHAAGAEILAHDNTKLRLSTRQEIGAFGAVFPPAPIGARPTRTFADTSTLNVNGEHILLSHYAPAHTDSDIAIFFSEADVVHAGDTWFNGFYPFIDYSSGGNIDGMIAAATRTLGVGAASTKVIPGHGPVGDKAQLSEYRDLLVAVREKVASLKKAGRTLPEIVAAKPTAAYDERWGKGLIGPDVFVGLVYQGM